MKNSFVLKLTLLILLLSGITIFTRAQDSVRKAMAVKKTAVKPPAAIIDPATGKPVIPINPKTGKPYTRYGYGYYSKYKYSAKAIHIADSLKKVAALKTTVAAGGAITPVAPHDTAAPVTAAPVTDKSLNGQYKYLLTKVYNYQQPFVAAIWKTFMDTLTNTRNQLKAAQQKIDLQVKNINTLQTAVNNKDQTISSETDMISFLGIELSKTLYSSIMWGLVIIIGIVAGVVIARAGGYRHEAVRRTKLYNELEEEFKAYKAKANDKEKKLARELQTERNKVDELMGRG
jgi:hypothetical protein